MTTDLFGNKVFQASREKETIADIIKRIGVVTDGHGDKATWTLNGKTILRPSVNRWVSALQEEFQIVIEFKEPDL